MKQPIEVKMTYEEGEQLGYVRYAPHPLEGVKTIRIGEAAFADLSTLDDLILVGIELLDLLPLTLEQAKKYADRSGYAFPRDLSGVQAVPA